MHAVIRIICFLVVGGFLSLGGALEHGLAALLITLGYLLWGIPQMGKALRMLSRLRWLFLSILVVYFWFTPGDLLLPSWQAWSPTVQGVGAGVLRMLTLILLVLAVSLLLQLTSREDLIAALVWLLSPLRRLHITPERLAVRMMLSMEKVVEVQRLYGELATAPGAAEKNRLTRFATRLLTLFEAVLARATQEPSQSITIPCHASPLWYQWGYPLAIGLVFILFRYGLAP